MRDTLRSVTSLAEIVLWRDGGQRRSRRNAWAAMAADTRRARERADAAAAVEHARGDRTATAAR
jgi:hypothetical protein